MMIPDIFYVEDDPDYSFIVKSILTQVDETLTIEIIANGKEALDVLINILEANKRPRLILLDFNLPGLSGLELVKKIREIPFLNSIPILIFSTANNPKDIKMCIEAGANEYIVKVAGYAELSSSMEGICERWLGVMQH